MKIKTTLLTLLPVAAAACSDGQPVDIGHTEAQLSDYAAHWDGYAEAFTFGEGGSDRVRLVLDELGEGTLEVGNAPPDPTPTDPGVGLPGQPGKFHDGFQYPIHGAVVEAGRVRFDVDPGTRYASWCAIQAPVATSLSPTGYSCVAIPSQQTFTQDLTNKGECDLWDVTPQSEGHGNLLTNPTPVSCARYLPCVYGICGCSPSGCAYEPTTPRPDGYKVRVDGALDDGGTSLVGTLVIYADWDHPTDATDRMTVRLARH
jgi:hypothetical protein